MVQLGTALHPWPASMSSSFSCSAVHRHDREQCMSRQLLQRVMLQAGLARVVADRQQRDAQGLP